MRDLYEDVRDVIILHKARRRAATRFWNRCSTMDIPASFQRKIDLLRAKVRMFHDGPKSFATTSWVAVALGQHIFPDEYEPAVDALAEDKVAAALKQRRRRCLGVAGQLPGHRDFLRHVGAEPRHPS